MYQISDCQFNGGRLFADGATFKTRKEVREQLINYHSIDCDYKELRRMTLDELLAFGEWELVEVREEELRQ